MCWLQFAASGLHLAHAGCSASSSLSWQHGAHTWHLNLQRLQADCSVDSLLFLLQALRQEADAADRFAAHAFVNTKAAHAALRAAEAAAMSAEGRLQASEELISTLERRLERAREGGRKALAAAAAAAGQQQAS